MVSYSMSASAGIAGEMELKSIPSSKSAVIGAAGAILRAET